MAARTHARTPAMWVLRCGVLRSLLSSYVTVTYVILKCNGAYIYTPPPPMFCGGEETTP